MNSRYPVAPRRLHSQSANEAAAAARLELSEIKSIQTQGGPQSSVDFHAENYKGLVQYSN